MPRSIQSFLLLAPGEWRDLFSSCHHPRLFQRERARFILSRVRIIAALLAILAPFRLAVDDLQLPHHLFILLDSGRIIVAVVFAILAFFCRCRPTPRNARLAMVMLFLIPAFFFLFSHVLLAHAQLNGAAEHFDKYTYLPFILVAIIGVFPMALLEILVLTLSLLTVFALPLWLREDPRILPELIDLALVASVAALAAMSQLQSMKRLFVQSSTDPLTGLFNRRAGEDLLTLLFAQAERHSHALSIAMLDVDNFKGVNDTWGHEVGDRVLQDVAQLLQSGVRMGDAVIRWGGEEFVVVMPYANSGQAQARLQVILDGHIVQKPNGQPIRMSGGIAELQDESGKNWRDLIKLADNRMYQVKIGGKGRIATGIRLEKVDMWVDEHG
ncbi:diguanylate cyclase [Acidithiobacillus sp.]|uniref:GGDEF domain-containing protein n=1 Tax=Acidithiobacillus sp. TaxID=1872118 RepID=UPI0025BAEC22|nr:GGDEF domain-containing protein [Acidithiobacillus sp.]